MANINLDYVVQRVEKMKSNILIDVRKYAFTIFKRSFKSKTRLKSGDLTGDNRTAFDARKNLDKKSPKKSIRKILTGSKPGEMPRQGSSKYLSNKVRYTDEKNAAVIYLDVPFGKALDEGGNSPIKAFKNPYQWMGLDIVKSRGESIYGKVVKMRSQKIVPMYSSIKKGLSFFSSGSAITQLFSRDRTREQKNRRIAARPFTRKILIDILKTGFVERTIKKYSFKR